MWPVWQREAALRAQHQDDNLTYINARDAYDEARNRALKGNKGAFAEIIKASLDKLGPPPEPPLLPMLTCTEPTYEGLLRLLAIGQPSVGIFAGEGGQFVGGHSMSDEARLRSAAGFSELWDGSPARRVRAGDGSSVLPGRRLSLHLMAQPGVADGWLRDRVLIDQGMLSRVLVSSPESAMGGRLSRAEKPETAPALRRYGARLLNVLERPMPLANGRSNELQPRPLPLSPDAAHMFYGFADRIEKMLRKDGQLRPISGLANKLPEHAGRIGGVLTLVRDITATEIAAAEMASGIELVQHYAAEALRLHGGSQVSADLRLAAQALDWITMHWSETVISLPDLYQRGPAAIRDGKAARQVVKTLEDHGYLRNVSEGAEVAGVRRREAWRIVKG